MSGIDEVRPRSWSELQTVLFDEPWPQHAGQFHSNLIHRGMRDSTWRMQSSLERRGLVDLEGDLLRSFKRYAQHVDVDRLKTWEWLTIAQHHGLPTRLMDWTYSPLVALHFATDEADPKTDGVVWSLDYARTYERLPRRMKRALTGGVRAFTTEMLDTAKITLTRVPKSRTPYLVVLEPPSIDERVVNQYAGLSFMSDPRADIESWLQTFSEPVAQRIVVPLGLKAEVREKLDKANINERVIYPGLDGLSTWLSRYYTTGTRNWVHAPTPPMSPT